MSDPILNLAAFSKGTRLAGPGLRDLVWLQGCSIGCVGCANLAYQAHVPRVLLPVSRLIAHFRTRIGRIDGCTISGGEPSQQAQAVTTLLRAVQALGLSTVIYSGRTLRDLEQNEDTQNLLRYTDMLIDGPFVAARPDRHPWLGSSNQKIYLLSQRWSAEQLAPPATESEIILHPRSLTRIGAVSPFESE